MLRPFPKIPLRSQLKNAAYRAVGRNTIYYTSLRERLAFQIRTSLQDLLRYADRNSMGNSREVRLPYLSHHLVEFLFSLPDSFILQDGWTKFIQRKSLSDSLPAEICWKAEKIGFEPPQQRWMQSPAVSEIVEQQRKQFAVQEKATASYSDSVDWRLLASHFLQ